MADYEARVSAIADLVAAVAGSGQVHNRNRNTADWGKFIHWFLDADRRINGWQISRKSPSGTREARWVETYQLVKFYGIRDQDGSDLAFQQNLDDVGRLFVDGYDLSFGTASEGFRITVIEERMFGDVLCHVAECEITVSFYTRDL